MNSSKSSYSLKFQKKSARIKSLLKSNPSLADILKSDVGASFVKGIGKGKKDLIAFFVNDKMVTEMINLIIVQDLVADSVHCCHYASVILCCSNSTLMEFLFSDMNKYVGHLFECLSAEKSKDHFLHQKNLEVPNILYYFSICMKVLFDFNPQKMFKLLTDNPKLNEALIRSSYFSSAVQNTIIYMVTSKNSILTLPWLEVFIEMAFNALFSNSRKEIILLFFHLSKAIQSMNDAAKSKFMSRMNQDLFYLVIDLMEYQETAFISQHAYNSLTYYCGLNSSLKETFLSCTYNRTEYFGRLILSKSARVAHTALMLIQSHVANGNYEVLSVLPHLLKSFLKYDNRSVFSQEVLNTLNYIWYPANNAKSDKLILLKKQFLEFNIVAQIDKYLKMKTNRKPLKPWLLKLLFLIPKDEWTSEFESRIQLLRYEPEMPSFILSKKLQKHRQAIMSDSTRQLIIDRAS